MHRAEDVAEVGFAMQPLQPACHAGEVIAFQAEAHIEAVGKPVARFRHHVNILRQLGVGHARESIPAVGHGAVAGESDAAQSLADGFAGVVGG